MLLTRLVLAILGGAALSGSFEPLAWNGLALPAIGLFVLATKDLRVRGATSVGLAFGATFYFSHIWWMREAVGTDAWIALSAVESLFYAAMGAVTPLLRRLWLWPVWFAATWATMEMIRSNWPFSGMPWGRVSFAAIDSPVAASSAYVGLLALSFLVVLLGALLAALVETWWRPVRVTHRPPRRLLVATGLVAVGGGLLVPALVPYDVDDSETATVAVIQGNVPGRGDDILLDSAQVTRNHTEATEQLAEDVAAGRQPQPDFVLWPENTTAVDPFADPAIRSDIDEAAKAVGAPVVIGGIVDDGEEYVLNQGIVWDPETGPGDRYTKQNPVAYGEYIPLRRYWDPKFGDLALITRDMKTGTRTEPLQIGDIEVADAICFDIAYDDVMREQVRGGAQMLAVQSSNVKFIFTDQIDQQFAITRLRAIETGRWLSVATPNGRSGVIAPDGTVITSADERTAQTLVQQVGLSETITPAMRYGVWPARVFTLLSVTGLVLGGFAYRRKRDDAGDLEEVSEPESPAAGIAADAEGDSLDVRAIEEKESVARPDSR